jgi:hypothetical protein
MYSKMGMCGHIKGVALEPSARSLGEAYLEILRIIQSRPRQPVQFKRLIYQDSKVLARKGSESF